MRITIRAKSSTPGDGPYDVTFALTGSRLTASCSCPAGVKSKNLCRHRTELLEGDETRLADPSELPQLQQLRDLVQHAPELQRAVAQVNESERIIREEQAKMKKIKTTLAEQLREGLEIQRP